MSEELKPCPFCGGPNVERYMAGIECADCGARAPDDLTWNKRASRDAEVQRLREALRDALSVASSVSVSRDRRIVREGCVLYAQTEEWCKWVEDEVAPKLRAALKESA